jgi:predicted nucleotidyltransferase
MDALTHQIVETIVPAIQPRKIILFGSRAQGRQGQDSDVDLLIVYDGGLSKRDVKLAVRRLFSNRDFSMDIFVLSPDEFERQQKVVSTIGRVAALEGIVCYG